MKGTVGILNVGAGDVTITFDKSMPAERERAASIVTDMLKRGYAILVQVGEQDGEPHYRRAKGFDPETCEYIVVGMPEPTEIAKPEKKRPGRKPRETRLQAESTRAVAVSRSAGG